MNLYNGTVEKANSTTFRQPTPKQLAARKYVTNRKPKRTDLEIYKDKIFTIGKHTIRDEIVSESKRYKGKRAKYLRDHCLYLPVYKSHNFDKCGRLDTMKTWVSLTRIIKNNWRYFKGRHKLSAEEKLWLERLEEVLNLH